MNRKPLAELIPVLAKGIGPTTAVATGLLAPVALGASGDLDPEFADGGRLGPIPELGGAAWSVEALDGDGVLIGGGDTTSIAATGTNAPTYFRTSRAYSPKTAHWTRHSHAQASNDVEALDVTRQPDGQVVAVGRRLQDAWPGRDSSRSGSGSTVRWTPASERVESSNYRCRSYGRIHRGTAI